MDNDLEYNSNNSSYDLEGSDSQLGDSGPLIYVGKTDLTHGLMHNAVFMLPLPEWLETLRQEDPAIRDNLVTLEVYAQRRRG